MKSTTVLRMVVSLSLLALLASCAPTFSSNSADSYQNSKSDQSNIIGGETADAAYQLANGVVGIMDLNKGALCTGSLIARNLVLTAAHCVNTFSAKAMVVFFTPNMTQSIKMTNGKLLLNKNTVRQVAQAVRNSKYNPQSDSMTESTNDIALLRLVADAPAEIQTAALPPAGLALKQGDMVSLAGYGVSQFKMDPSTGEALLSKGSGLLRKADDIKVQTVLPSGEEVTFDQSQGRGACHGDSGGPAYLKVAATETTPAATYVVGVTSRGPGDCNEIAVYSSTIGQAKWIAATSAVLLKAAATDAKSAQVVASAATSSSTASEDEPILPSVGGSILKPILK
ncbi:MAG: trypsin-like serine protease [Bdellovibrio sp.]|nr:trypsin-like serine protease [Bdellovibrio sp.]